jgi:hypothetical protein
LPCSKSSIQSLPPQVGNKLLQSKHKDDLKFGKLLVEGARS